MLGGLGGLFKSPSQVNPSEVTAHAKEKLHGPFPVQVELKENTSNTGERTIEAYYTAQTTKGVGVGINTKFLLEDIQELYEKRLQEKSADNAATKVKAAANKVAANKAAAEALDAKVKEEGIKAKKEQDKLHMYEVVQYLTKKGYKHKTDPVFVSVVDPSDEAKYNELKLSESLIQKYGNKEKKTQAANATNKASRYSSMGSNTVGGKRRTRYRRGKRRNSTKRH